MITLTDNAASKVKNCWPPKVPTTWHCASPCAPADAAATATMFFDGDVAADDEQALFGPDKSVKVIVDARSSQLLVGATLDYKDGLDDSGFKITNPNASRVRLRPELLLIR